MTDIEILQAFDNGEWCDTADICRLMDITFAEGFRAFDFSRMAEWCPEPYNGQRITTKFRRTASNG